MEQPRHYFSQIENNQWHSEAYQLKNKLAKNTDCCALDVFILFMLTMLALMAFALGAGNPHIIGRPMDPDHLTCGADELVQDYPYIYFPSPVDGYLYRSVCVSECPNVTNAIIQCKTNSLIGTCSNQPNPNPNTSFLVYPTVPYLTIVCLPTLYPQIEVVAPILQFPKQQQILHNMYICRPLVLFSFFLAVFISCLLFRMMDRYTFVVIWLFASMIVISLFLASLNFYIQAESNRKVTITETQIEQNIPLTYSQAAAYVGEVANNVGSQYFYFFFFFLCGLYKIYKFAQKMQDLERLEWGMRLASEFVSFNPKIIQIPIIISLLLLGSFELWLNAMLHLLTMEEQNPQPNSVPFQEFEINPIGILMAFLVSGLWAWATVFLCLIVDCMSQSLSCQWYHNHLDVIQNGGDHDYSQVTKAVLRHHLGSIAVCAGWTVVLTPIKIILYPIKFSEPILSKILYFTVLKQCYQRLLRFYNVSLQRDDTNTFTIIYLSSQDYSTSLDQVRLLAKDHEKVYAYIDKLGDLHTHRGALFTAVICGLFSFALFHMSPALQQQVLTPIYPSIISGLLAYQRIIQVGYVFMAVFGESLHGLCCTYLTDRKAEIQSTSFGDQAPLVVRNYFYLIEKMFKVTQIANAK